MQRRDVGLVNLGHLREFHDDVAEPEGKGVVLAKFVHADVLLFADGSLVQGVVTADELGVQPSYPRDAFRRVDADHHPGRGPGGSFGNTGRVRVVERRLRLPQPVLKRYPRRLRADPVVARHVNRGGAQRARDVVRVPFRCLLVRPRAKPFDGANDQIAAERGGPCHLSVILDAQILRAERPFVHEPTVPSHRVLQILRIGECLVSVVSGRCRVVIGVNVVVLGSSRDELTG